MKTYGQYCPITKAAEVVGDRWTIPILRDLLCGTTRFNDLARGLPRLSRALLTKRLRKLEDAALVEHVGDQYLLTAAGRALEPVIFGLGEWSAAWTLERPMPSELDTDVLMWWMQHRIDHDRAPDRRTVVQVVYPDVQRRYWLVIEPHDASVCMSDPGFDIDLIVTADASTMYEAWLGRLDVRDAITAGAIRVEGPPRLASSFPAWLQLSPIAYASQRIAAR
jgi:DNA-binding HxlR family transcriptional regulator